MIFNNCVENLQKIHSQLSVKVGVVEGRNTFRGPEASKKKCDLQRGDNPKHTYIAISTNGGDGKSLRAERGTGIIHREKEKKKQKSIEEKAPLLLSADIHSSVAPGLVLVRELRDKYIGRKRNGGLRIAVERSFC